MLGLDDTKRRRVLGIRRKARLGIAYWPWVDTLTLFCFFSILCRCSFLNLGRYEQMI